MAKNAAKRDADIKRMSELLKEGATMMAETCPDCKVPIFKLPSGEMICPSCNRRVIFAKSTEVESVASQSSAATELEDVMQKKIKNLKEKMEKTDDPEELEHLSKSLASLLDTIQKVRRQKP